MYKTRSLWMVVDLKNDDLPMFVGKTASEVAQFAGTTQNAVSSAVAHAKVRGNRSKFVRIDF